MKLRSVLYLFILMFILLFTCEGVYALDHGITLKAVVCDSEMYNSSEAIDNYDNCYYDYKDGLLDTYIKTNDTDIDPGTMIMVIASYTFGDVSEVTGINAVLDFDPDIWTPAILDGDIYYNIDTASYPQRSGSKRAQWNNYVTYDEATSKIVVYVDEASGNGISFTEDEEIGYFYMTLNSDAPTGETADITFSTDPGEVTVVNVDGDKLGYTTSDISFNIPGDSLSHDASLGSLTVSNSSTNYNLSPTFVVGSVETNVYSTVVPNDITSVTINATTNNTKASILSGSIGKKDLSVGDNSFSITVTSEYGNTEVYTINVYRLSNDATLSSINFTNNISLGDIVDGQYAYTTTIPFATKNTTVSATTNHSNAYVDSGLGNWELTNSGDLSNNKILVVKAENCLSKYSSVPGNTCTSQNYTLTVNREAASTNSYLKSLTVDGTLISGFDKTVEDYDLGEVSYSTETLLLNGAVEDTGKAKVSGLGEVNLNVGENEFTITVTAEDGSTRDYTVKVYRLSKENKLSSLTVTSNPSATLSPTFVNTFYGVYNYNYEATVTQVAISATVLDTDKAKVAIYDSNNVDLTTLVSDLNTQTKTFGLETTNVVVMVTAEDGTVANYTINLSRAKSTDSTLKTLSLDKGTLNPTFVPNTKVYTAVVDPDVTSVSVTALPNSAYATVKSIEGNDNLDFGSNQIEVIVEAEDKSTSSYFINVTREEYDIATLDDILVDGVSIKDFEPNTFEYTLDAVVFEKTKLNIKAEKTNSYSTVSGEGDISLNTGENEIKITVTAQNGVDKNTYVLKVKRAKNDDNSIGSLKVKGVDAVNTDEGIYAVTLPNDVTQITPSDVEFTAPSDAEVSKTMTLDLSTKQDNIYTFTVTSESGNTQVYTIKITRTKSNDSSISKVTLTIGEDSSRYCIMDENNTCKIQVPVTTSEFSLSADIHAEATISPVNGTSYQMPASESYKTVHLTVTAEDNTNTVYTVNIERQKSSNNNLSDLKVDGVTVTGFNPSKQTYELTVDGDTDKVNVSATVEDTGKSSIITDLTQPFNLDFDVRNQIEVTVKAEDGTEKTYTIYITRSHRQDITLKNLTINGIQIDGFTSIKDDYTLNDLPYNTYELNIEATPNDDNATKTGDGKVRINTGSNDITITVIAHDPTVTHDYVIHVNRELNNDTSIKGMTLAGNQATYNSETKKYEVTIPNSVTEANSTNLTVEVNDPITTLDKKATYTVATTTLLTTQTNDVIVTVTAEDGTIDTHTLVVTREKSDVATLSSLTVTNGSFNPSFKSDTFEYVVAVPVETTEFDVVGVVTEPHAKIISGDGNHKMTQSNMTIEVVVESEDSSETRTYTLNIERQKSSNNNLSDLKVDGVTVTGFDPSKQTYELTVDGDTDKVNVSAIVEDTGKSSIITDLTQPFNLDFDIRNQIEVTVKAEDGTEKTYTIYITRSHRQDITLKNLTINGIQIDGFTSTKDDYTLNDLPYNTHQINIEATPNDDNATKTGDGLIRINTGSNDITITVIAHDPEVTHDYVIHVNRELNNDTSIKGMTLAGTKATYNSKTKKYEVTVPNNVDEANSSNLTVEVNDPITTLDKKATYIVPTTQLLTTQTNDVIVTVTAEDGTIKTYTLVVTREKSDVATLSSLTVTNGSFNPSFKSDTFEYEVTVPVDTTDFNVSGVVTEPHANITSGVGYYTMDQSTKYIEVVVVSEDLSKTNIYKLNVVRTKSSDNTLSDITVSEGTLSPVFSSETTSYTVNVAGNIDSIDIGATLNDGRATIVSGPGTYSLSVGDNPVTIHVQSESGASLYYNINVVRAQKEDNNLLDLTVDGSTVPGFDKDTTSYTLSDVGYSKTTIDIGATLSDSDATVSGLGVKTLKTGLNTFDVVVTAQNGTVKTYTINITREKNNNAYLNILAINGYVLTPNFDSETFDYEVTVDSNKETLSPSDVTAVAKDSNAIISKQAEITLSTTVDNYYKVTVTAEDGVTTQDYTIKVIRPKSSDTSLASVNVTGATISPTFESGKYNYTVTIPYGSESFNIQGIANDPKTTVFGNGEYKLEDGVVTLTTVAEDGSTGVYTFHIVEALSNDATLSDLSVSGYSLDKTFKSTELSYSIGNIPYGTTQLKVNASSTNASAAIEYYVNGVKQDSNIVNIPEEIGSKKITVKVIAADGVTTKSYTIDYTVVSSSNAYLSSLVPSKGTIDFLKTTTYYEITVDNDVTEISFDLTTEDSNALVTFDGESFFTPKTITISDLVVGNNNVSILVTAQDGVTKKPYEVVVKRLEPVASSDANLSSLSVDNYQLDKTFDIDTLEYSIGKIPFALTELTINATPNVGTSTIAYLVNGVKQTGNKVTLPKTEGISAIVVQVTAEDGKTIKNYKITYEKVASTNAYLSNIIVSSGELKFNKNTFNYTVDVDSTTTSIDVTAITEDQTAVMQMNKVTYTSPHTLTLSPLSNGVNEVIIIVTAENGNVLTYKVTINKKSDIATTITSEEYGHTIVNGYIKTVKLPTTGIELKNQLDNPNEYLEIWTADESAKVEDTENLATGMIVKLMINGEEKDRKVIVIKGDTSGDGEIDLFDAVKILNHYLVKTPLTGAYLEAAYVNDDTEIDLFDSVMILNHYLGKISLH